MKISQNPPSQAQGLDKATQVEKSTQAATQKTGSAAKAKSGSAAVEISEGAQLMKQATEIAKSAPDVRADRIKDLKQRIQAGTYEIDNDKLAEKIIEEHLLTDFGKNKV